jgi:radical SAM superfamily enzyme YgiQ (UPF0313 family)
MLEILIGIGCKRVDLFFMIGLPYQDYLSVIETVRYCEGLLERYGSNGRILPMIAPLAPFIDPYSNIFEEPERFGYKLFCKTLREHRQAMLMPSWKYTLNYETIWMTRDDIVRATYDGAVVSPSWNKVGILAAIVAIRTVLSYFLRMEVKQTRG